MIGTSLLTSVSQGQTYTLCYSMSHNIYEPATDWQLSILENRPTLAESHKSVCWLVTRAANELFDNDFFHKFVESFGVLLWSDGWNFCAGTVLYRLGGLRRAFLDAVVCKNIHQRQEIDLVAWRWTLCNTQSRRDVTKVFWWKLRLKSWKLCLMCQTFHLNTSTTLYIYNSLSLSLPA